MHINTSVDSSDSNVEPYPTSPLPTDTSPPRSRPGEKSDGCVDFLGSPWICLCSFSCSILCVVRKCLRIVLKCQRLILMEQKRPRKPTDEWICQRIFKWISSSLVCKGHNSTRENWIDRDHVKQKYFSFFVTHQLLPTLLFTWWLSF